MQVGKTARSLLVCISFACYCLSSSTQRDGKRSTRRLSKVPVQYYVSPQIALSENRTRDNFSGVFAVGRLARALCQSRKYRLTLTHSTCLPRTVYVYGCLGACMSYRAPSRRHSALYTLRTKICQCCNLEKSKMMNFVISCKHGNGYVHKRIQVQSAVRCSCQRCTSL